MCFPAELPQGKNGDVGKITKSGEENESVFVWHINVRVKKTFSIDRTSPQWYSNAIKYSCKRYDKGEKMK